MRSLRARLLLVSLLALPAGQAAALPPAPAESPLLQLIARGDTALAARDSISAIFYYREAVTRAPRDARGYTALGRAYLAVREPEHAREAFESGLRHTNGSEALSLGLVEVYEQLGQYERALTTARAIARDADDVLFVNDTLARLAERRGAYTEALAARRRKLSRLRADAREQSPDGEVARALYTREETHIRALMLLIGGPERLSRQQCVARPASVVLTALLGCR